MFKNKIVLILGIVLLGVIAFFAYKYFGGSYSTKTAAPTASQIPANSVVIQSNAFSPDPLTVKVGQKVTWVNNDSYAHTITSDDATFDSGSIGVGQSFSYSFTKAGTYNYHCTIHPFMRASVVVTN